MFDQTYLYEAAKCIWGIKIQLHCSGCCIVFLVLSTFAFKYTVTPHFCYICEIVDWGSSVILAGYDVGEREQICLTVKFVT